MVKRAVDFCTQNDIACSAYQSDQYTVKGHVVTSCRNSLYMMVDVACAV